MNISPDLWNEIFRYASEYPKYKDVSKKISSYYKPQIDEEYIYSMYKDFDSKNFDIFKYQINRACLKKEYYVIKFMLSKLEHRIINNKWYILCAIEILHRFGQFNIALSIVKKYLSYDLYLPLSYNICYGNVNIKYNFLICIYHLYIDEKAAKVHLDKWKKCLDLSSLRGSSTKYLIGYINSYIYNYLFNYKENDKYATIELYDKRYDIELDTHLDTLSYLIATDNFYLISSYHGDQGVLELLSSIDIATVYICNYIYGIINNSKEKLNLSVSILIHNPIIIRLFKDYHDNLHINDIGPQINPVYKLALEM